MKPRPLFIGLLLAALVVGFLGFRSRLEVSVLLSGLVPAVVVFVPLFRAEARSSAVPGPGLGRREPLGWEVLGEARQALAALSRRGWVWSVALPIAWLLVYYGFVAHVRLALGRWPTFGESLDGVFLDLHLRICWWGLGALITSLMPVAGVFVVSLCLRRWRPIAVYALGYAAAVGLAFGGVFLAPGPFLNWFFD